MSAETRLATDDALAPGEVNHHQIAGMARRRRRVEIAAKVRGGRLQVSIYALGRPGEA